MKSKILSRLYEIEAEENVRIVYACESGSRAWGFPFADSDYDVRLRQRRKDLDRSRSESGKDRTP